METRMQTWYSELEKSQAVFPRFSSHKGLFPVVPYHKTPQGSAGAETQLLTLSRRVAQYWDGLHLPVDSSSGAQSSCQKALIALALT